MRSTAVFTATLRSCTTAGYCLPGSELALSWSPCVHVVRFPVCVFELSRACGVARQPPSGFGFASAARARPTLVVLAHPVRRCAAPPRFPPGVDWCSTPANACMRCDLCCLLRGSPCWPRPPFAPAQALRLVLFACLPCPACPACTSTIELHLYLCKTPLSDYVIHVGPPNLWEWESWPSWWCKPSRRC